MSDPGIYIGLFTFLIVFARPIPCSYPLPCAKGLSLNLNHPLLHLGVRDWKLSSQEGSILFTLLVSGCLISELSTLFTSLWSMQPCGLRMSASFISRLVPNPLSSPRSDLENHAIPMQRYSTLIKKKIKFYSYKRKFWMEQLPSHILYD